MGVDLSEKQGEAIDTREAKIIIGENILRVYIGSQLRKTIAMSNKGKKSACVVDTSSILWSLSGIDELRGAVVDKIEMELLLTGKSSGGTKSKSNIKIIRLAEYIPPIELVTTIINGKSVRLL